MYIYIYIYIYIHRRPNLVSWPDLILGSNLTPGPNTIHGPRMGPGPGEPGRVGRGGPHGWASGGPKKGSIARAI